MSAVAAPSRPIARRAALPIAVALLGVLLLAVAASTAVQLREAAHRLDDRAFEALTLRFEPAFAPGLYAALGPTRAVYGTFAVATLLAALITRWRSLPWVMLALGAAAGLSVALGWVMSAIIVRPGPLAIYPDAPVAAEWRAAWQLGGSFPSVHTLVCAALAHTLVRAWPVVAVSAYPIALAAGVAAVFFGQAWASDALAGLVLGVLVAELARWASGTVLSRAMRRVEPA
jgi:membrane-associated phospholipid phosphatase